MSHREVFVIDPAVQNVGASMDKLVRRLRRNQRSICGRTILSCSESPCRVKPTCSSTSSLIIDCNGYAKSMSCFAIPQCSEFV